MNGKIRARKKDRKTEQNLVERGTGKITKIERER